jgi:hypothetical protein
MNKLGEFPRRKLANEEGRPQVDLEQSDVLDQV